MLTKKLCPIHHLFYNGVECPLCLKERISKFSNISKDSNDRKQVEITENDLNKLKEKFNSK